MKKSAIFAVAVCAFAAIQLRPAPGDYSFLVKPYLQLGNRPGLQSQEALSLLWHTADVEEDWKVEVRAGAAAPWSAMRKPTSARVRTRGLAPYRVYTGSLEKLAPGEQFDYRLSRAGAVVFESRGRARKPPAAAYQFAVLGDIGANTLAQRRIAYQTWKAQPDVVMITGDVVYSRGRATEYATNFFPIYNTDEPSDQAGAPLIRSTLFIAAPGNHDIAVPDLGTYPDGLAYFYYWSQPLNGPVRALGDPNSVFLRGPESDQDAFRRTAGDRYPSMASFSFDYGNAHWTVLDSNANVDWGNPELRSWIASDLRSAQKATWRFVAFHHPGFNSSRAHFNNQWMRGLSEVFEAGKVDIVFAGHVHNYQRSYPLKFKGKALDRNTGRFDGSWTLDKTYDGSSMKRPNGIIYLVTGAGGAGLYDVEQQEMPESWQEFTTRFISKEHSFTLVTVKGRELSVRQISDSGQEVDSFSLEK